jgi:hypothetical protein
MDAVEAPAKAEIPPELTARWAIANAMTLKRDSFGTRQRGEASVGRGRNHVKDRTDGLLEASRRRLAGSASIPIMAEAAEDQYFNALAEEEWASSERKLRFMVHFADILTTLEMDVLCVVGTSAGIAGTVRSLSTLSRKRRSSVTRGCTARYARPAGSASSRYRRTSSASFRPNGKPCSSAKRAHRNVMTLERDDVGALSLDRLRRDTWSSR